MLYALKHPEKIKKLILYNAAIIRDKKLKKKNFCFPLENFQIFRKNLFQKNFFICPKKLIIGLSSRAMIILMANENLKENF
jgi:pimeloyl-ACP methyl ester carboxylesterase